jgi:hypothetical protein
MRTGSSACHHRKQGKFLIALTANQAVGVETGFPRGDELGVAVESGRWVLTKLPAGQRPNCSDAIFRTTEKALQRS